MKNLDDLLRLQKEERRDYVKVIYIYIYIYTHTHTQLIFGGKGVKIQINKIYKIIYQHTKFLFLAKVKKSVVKIS